MTYDELAEQMTYEAVCDAQWEADERAQAAAYAAWDAREDGNSHE